eukprot:11879_1
MAHLQQTTRTMPNVTLLINKKSKWFSELNEICREGYNTKSTTNFDRKLDVMIQTKPKQVVCVINGADLMFVWKRKEEIERVKDVAKYFKHAYVVVIIKHNLELMKTNQIFNGLSDILDVNI